MSQPTPDTYLPVSVEGARAIASSFRKDVVVIVSWDRPHNLIHTTTYGKTAIDKVAAATLGEVLTTAAGCDIGKHIAHEDFKARTAADWAVEREAMQLAITQLVRAALGADHAIASVVAVRTGITDDVLISIRERLNIAIALAKKGGFSVDASS